MLLSMREVMVGVMIMMDIQKSLFWKCDFNLGYINTKSFLMAYNLSIITSKKQNKHKTLNYRKSSKWKTQILCKIENTIQESNFD